MSYFYLLSLLVLFLPSLANANLGVFNKEKIPNNGRVYGVVAKYYNEIPQLSSASCVFISENFSDYKICEMDLYIGESVIIQCEQFDHSKNVLYLSKEPLFISKKYGSMFLNKLKYLLHSSYIERIKPNIKISEIKKFGYSATLLQWPWDGTEPTKQYDLNFNCVREHANKNISTNLSSIKIRLMPSPKYREETQYLNLKEVLNTDFKKIVKYYKHLTYGQNLEINGEDFKIVNYNSNEIKSIEDILNNNLISREATLPKPSQPIHKYVTVGENSATVNLKDSKNIFGKEDTNIIHIIVGYNFYIPGVVNYIKIVIYLYAPTYYSRLIGCGNIDNYFADTSGTIKKLDKTCYINPNTKETIALHCDVESSSITSDDWSLWKSHDENIPLSDVIKVESLKNVSPSLSILSYSPIASDLNNFKYMDNYEMQLPNINILCKAKDSPDYDDEEYMDAKFVFGNTIINDFENDPTLSKINRYESFLYPGGYVQIDCPVFEGKPSKVGPFENGKIFIRDDTKENFKLKTVDIDDIATGLSRTSNGNTTKLVYSSTNYKIKGDLHNFYLTCYASDESNTDKFIGITKIFLMDKPLDLAKGIIDYSKINKLNPGDISFWSLPQLSETDLEIDCSNFFNKTKNIKIDIYPDKWNAVILERPGENWKPDTAVTADYGHSFLSNGLIIGKNNEKNNIINAQMSDYATLISQHKIPFYYVCIATDTNPSPEIKEESVINEKDPKLSTKEANDNVKLESTPDASKEKNYAMAVFEWVPPTIYKKIKGCGINTSYFIDDNGNDFTSKSCEFDITNRDIYEDPIAFHCPTSVYKKNPIKCYDKSSLVDNTLHKNPQVSIFGNPTNLNEQRSLWYVDRESVNKLKSSNNRYVKVECYCYDENEKIISSISITNNANYLAFSLLLIPLLILY